MLGLAMAVAVLGAGAMGTAAVRLLARHPGHPLLVLDVDEERARRAVAAAGHGEARGVDVEGGGLAEALGDVDAVAACLPYRLNLAVMEAALEAGCHYADLGGLYHTTLRQLELDQRFREAGLAAVLGIGSAPGITNVLARLGADRLDEVERVDLLDGAVEEGGEGGFTVPYAADTLLDEFTLPAIVLEDGELREVPAGSGALRHRFPDPVGEMEAVYTLHSELATLPATIEGVRDVHWRLALPPAVATGFRLLVELGLASEDPVETSAGRVSPREVLLSALARLPQPAGPPRDVEVIEVHAAGRREGRPATFLARATLRPSPEGLSAGAFGTALPIAVAARWLAAGRVAPGVHPPETAFPPETFLGDLAREGIRFAWGLTQELGP